MKLKQCLAVLILLYAASAGAADGPYVVKGPSGEWVARWIAADGAASELRQESVAVGTALVVPAVGSVPPLTVRLRPGAGIAPDEVRLGRSAKLFVIADTHGEYEIAVELLRKHGIIDQQLRWRFGRGHLVILGDVLDRGTNQIEILWLLYELEAQAAKAGGGVHLVLGNHEVMVLTGDLRYLNPKYVQTAQALGAGSYSELLGGQTLLGQWLRSKPAVLKIGKLLCMHGGISQALMERRPSLDLINTTVRQALTAVPGDQTDPALRDLILGRLGPLWYRGYFAEQKDFPLITLEQLDRIQHHFGVNRILVGHTIVPTVTVLYEGRVIAVQVYPRRDERTAEPVMEGVRIEGNRLLRARMDGTTERLL
jgi:Calcineurin-like phosphoesterase